MLRVSVIIPTCDRPLLLARALRSVAAQQRPADEIIVVDDGTAPAVIREAPPCLRHIANHRSKGVSGARNTGAAHARGEFLAFLDDDDEWAPSYLAEIAAHAEHHQADVLCTDFILRGEDGAEQARAASDVMTPDVFKPGLIGSNLVIRRGLFEALGGFDETLVATEDTDLGLRIGLCEGVRYSALHRPLVTYHQHQGPRLCTRGGAMREGIRRLYELHQHRMTDAQRATFRSVTVRNWGFDENGHDAEHD